MKGAANRSEDSPTPYEPSEYWTVNVAVIDPCSLKPLDDDGVARIWAARTSVPVNVALSSGRHSSLGTKSVNELVNSNSSGVAWACAVAGATSIAKAARAAE